MNVLCKLVLIAVFSAGISKGNDPESIEDLNNEETRQSTFLTNSDIESIVKFQCQNKPSGYYADPRFDCKVFHFCHEDGKRVTIPCVSENEKHNICIFKDITFNACEGSEIYLALPEDLQVKSSKDTTTSAINTATDFKLSNVLPLPTFPGNNHSTTPLSLEPEQTDKSNSLTDSKDVENIYEVFKSVLKEIQAEREQQVSSDASRQPNLSPSTFSRGSKFQASSIRRDDFSDALLSKNQRSDDQDAYLVEVYHKENGKLSENNPHYKKSKRFFFSSKIEKKTPGTHPRRRKRMVAQALDVSRPYAVIFAKVPESASNFKTARTDQLQSEIDVAFAPARVPADVPTIPIAIETRAINLKNKKKSQRKGMIEVPFVPAKVPADILTVPVTIETRRKKKSKSKKKSKDAPHTYYIEESPPEEKGIQETSEQRNVLFFAPEQIPAIGLQDVHGRAVANDQYRPTQNSDQTQQVVPQQENTNAQNPQNGFQQGYQNQLPSEGANPLQLPSFPFQPPTYFSNSAPQQFYYGPQDLQQPGSFPAFGLQDQFVLQPQRPQVVQPSSFQQPGPLQSQSFGQPESTQSQTIRQSGNPSQTPRQPENGRTQSIRHPETILPQRERQPDNISSPPVRQVQNTSPQTVRQAQINSPQIVRPPQHISPQSVQQVQNIPPQIVRQQEGPSSQTRQPERSRQPSIRQPEFISPPAFRQPESIRPQIFRQPESIPSQAFRQPGDIHPQTVRQPQSIQSHAFRQPEVIQPQTIRQLQNIQISPTRPFGQPENTLPQSIRQQQSNEPQLIRDNGTPNAPSDNRENRNKNILDRQPRPPDTIVAQRFPGFDSPFLQNFPSFGSLSFNGPFARPGPHTFDLLPPPQSQFVQQPNLPQHTVNQERPREQIPEHLRRPQDQAIPPYVISDRPQNPAPQQYGNQNHLRQQIPETHQPAINQPQSTVVYLPQTYQDPNLVEAERAKQERTKASNENIGPQIFVTIPQPSRPPRNRGRPSKAPETSTRQPSRQRNREQSSERQTSRRPQESTRIRERPQESTRIHERPPQDPQQLSNYNQRRPTSQQSPPPTQIAYRPDRPRDGSVSEIPNEVRQRRPTTVTIPDYRLQESPHSQNTEDDQIIQKQRQPSRQRNRQYYYDNSGVQAQTELSSHRSTPTTPIPSPPPRQRTRQHEQYLTGQAYPQNHKEDDEVNTEVGDFRPYYSYRTSDSPYERPRTTASPYERPRTTASQYERPRTTALSYERPRTTASHYEKLRATASPFERPRTPPSSHERPRTPPSSYERPRTSPPSYDRPRTLPPSYERPRESLSSYERTRESPQSYERIRESRPSYERPRTSSPENERPRTSVSPYEISRPSSSQHERSRTRTSSEREKSHDGLPVTNRYFVTSPPRHRPSEEIANERRPHYYPSEIHSEHHQERSRVRPQAQIERPPSEYVNAESLQEEEPRPQRHYSYRQQNRPSKENDVNVISTIEDSNYQPQTTSSETGRRPGYRGTASGERQQSNPEMERGFLPLSERPPREYSYSTRAPENEYGDPVRERIRENRYQDYNEEAPTTRLVTTPRPTKKRKPPPPRPTFPPFPTFPPPPRRIVTSPRPKVTEYPERELTQTTEYVTEEPKPTPEAIQRSRSKSEVITEMSESKHVVTENYFQTDVPETTTRRRTRKRRPKPRRPKTTTATYYDDMEDAVQVETKTQATTSKEITTRSTPSNYNRWRQETPTQRKSTTSAPSTEGPLSEALAKSEEFGSRINLFGRPRTRKPAVYSPRSSATTQTSVSSQERKRTSREPTVTRTRKPFTKRVKKKPTTTEEPDTTEIIARSDENDDTLHYNSDINYLQELESVTQLSIENMDEDSQTTEPYNDVVETTMETTTLNSQDNLPSDSDDKDENFESTRSVLKKFQNRPRILKFGKPRLRTTESPLDLNAAESKVQ